MLVRDLMTEIVQVLDPTSRLGEAVEIFEAEDIRHLPVMRGDELMGILASSDVLGLGKYLSAFDPDSPEHSALDLPVSDFMQADIMTLAPDATILAAIDLIVHLRIGAAPVVNPDTDELVGILSYIDLLRAARPMF